MLWKALKSHEKSSADKFCLRIKQSVPEERKNKYGQECEVSEWVIAWMVLVVLW